MLKKLLLAMACACIMAAAGGAGGSFIAVVFCPIAWKGVAQVEMDWDQMPIEASGGERGLIGRTLKSMLSYGDVALRDAYSKQSPVASQLGMTKERLQRSVEITASRPSPGTSVRYDLVVRGLDRMSCSRVLDSATEYVKSSCESYRALEGLTQASVLGREADRTGEYAGFWLSTLSMLAAEPVRVTINPHIERDFRVVARAAVILGTLSAGAASCATMLVFILMWCRQRTVVSAHPIIAARQHSAPPN